MNSNIPVLVLGANLTATAVLRSLAVAGIASFCVSQVADPPGFLRFCRFYRALPGRRSVKPCELAAYLDSCDLDRAVLMPCADDWVRAVACLPERIRARFPSSISPTDVVETLVDKWRFAEALDLHGIPHPRTALMYSLDELNAMPADRFVGAFIKPRLSFQFTRKYHVKGFLISSKQEAIDTIHRMSGGSPDCSMMLQEFIPGPPTRHFFVDGFIDRDGRLRAVFVRHRLRMYPLFLGNSTLQECVSPKDVLPAIESAQRLLGALKYQGIFSSEFKLDERDGEFKIIEVNARPWQSMEFATRCGINVCTLAYQDALGAPVDSAFDYRPGRRFVNLMKDAFAYSELRRSDHLTFAQWTRSWIGASEALLTWKDPFPALALWGQHAFSRHSASA